jgi:hypothetical protein
MSELVPPPTTEVSVHTTLVPEIAGALCVALDEPVDNRVMVPLTRASESVDSRAARHTAPKVNRIAYHRMTSVLPSQLYEIAYVIY